MTSYYMLIIFLCKIRALQMHDNLELSLTLFRTGRGAQGGGWGAKTPPPPPPTSFSAVTSTNVGFGPKTFLNFSCNTFSTLVRNFKFLLSASPKLLNLDQDHPSKKAIFLVKSLQN